jgi:hypothetical protein
MASSWAEQIIPSEIWPYFLLAPISNPVADREVDRAADHPRRLVRRLGQLARRDGDPTVPDRLLEAGQLLNREHLGHHHAADVVTD